MGLPFCTSKNESDMLHKIFEREYELEDSRGTLILHQEEEGDVNCVVWDAALVLAKYLEIRTAKNPNWISGRRICELGAGMGCVGITAACLGANVTLTDRAQAISSLEANICRNQSLVKGLGGAVSCKILDWNEEEINKDVFDVILLADCVYYKESIQPLIKTLLRLSNDSTEILLTQEDRSYSAIQKGVWIHFCDQLQEHFTMTIIPRNEQHTQFSSDDIFLFRLTKK